MLPVLANERVDKLRDYLGQRDEIGRIYMPQQLTQGQAAQILVMAPGAESVTVYGSRQREGNTSGLGLMLGADAITLAEAKLDASGRADLSLVIPAKPVVVTPEPTIEELKAAKRAEKKLSKEEKKAARLAKRAKPDPDIYYIEAVLSYAGGVQRKALVFGSNASYIGFNGMQVLPAAKDNAGVAQMARSFIPGMAGLPVGSY